MSPSRKASDTNLQVVRERAQGLCEYCHASEGSADGRLVIGLTPAGRATVAALDMNRARVASIRAADREVGRHPPAGDPIEPQTDGPRD